MTDAVTEGDLCLTEADVEHYRKIAGRDCGTCSMCCLLLDVPDAGKPDGAHWCPHCRPGRGGCMIYNDRPEVCRRYSCFWLCNGWLPDYWKPNVSHMIIDLDATKRPEIKMRVTVHPNYPTVWREEPYYSDLMRFSQRWQVEIKNAKL